MEGGASCGNSARRVVGELSHDGDQIFEPERLEIDFRAELVDLVDDGVLEALVTGDHHDRRIAAICVRGADRGIRGR